MKSSTLIWNVINTVLYHPDDPSTVNKYLCNAIARYLDSCEAYIEDRVTPVINEELLDLNAGTLWSAMRSDAELSNDQELLAKIFEEAAFVQEFRYMYALNLMYYFKSIGD